MSPQAIRVRTATGWKDIALYGPQGPQGIQGPAGAAGPTGPQGTMLAFRSTGGQPGTGAVISQSGEMHDSGASARQIVYTTPAIPTRGRIIWSARWDTQTGAWGWIATGPRIAPLPVADYGGGISAAQPWFRRIDSAHSACPWITPSGAFWVDLAASTTYTIYHTALAGSGNWWWDNSWRIACLTLEVYPR